MWAVLPPPEILSPRPASRFLRLNYSNS